MKSIHLIEHQPRWRVAMVARFAQLMGVLIHVEGFPFGSNRIYLERIKATGARRPFDEVQQGATLGKSL